MKRPESPVSDAWLPSWQEALVTLVLAGGFLGCMGSLAADPQDRTAAPFPYPWRDVAVVHVLCALPLAGALTVLARRRVSTTGLVFLAALVLGLCSVPFQEIVRSALATALHSHPPLGVVVRAGPALGLAVSASLVSAALLGGWRGRKHRAVPKHVAAVLGLGVVILLLPPAIHVRARCRHDVARLGELLEQQRFGEARTLARRLLLLDAGRTWNERPLPQVAEEIDRAVAVLESQVSVPLPPHAPAEARLERARRLAMLGRTEAAVAVLKSARTPATAPDVDLLYATIHENREEWEPAIEWHHRATQGWEARPSSPARTAGLLRATTGIAYCQRRLGRDAEAEETYQQALALSPTADSYFLLAQFYDDTQQTEKARAHARRAMELAPDRYRQAGEKLISKLTDRSFGCLGVFAAERDRSGPERPAPSTDAESP